MADTMQFDLVSPERSLVSVPVREVRLPGTDGDMTAMPGHAATIVTLRPGLVTVVDAQGNATEFAVTGGLPRSTANPSACWPSAGIRARKSRRMSITR